MNERVHSKLTSAGAQLLRADFRLVRMRARSRNEPLWNDEAGPALATCRDLNITLGLQNKPADGAKKAVAEYQGAGQNGKGRKKRSQIARREPGTLG